MLRLRDKVKEWILQVKESTIALELAGREWLLQPRDGMISLAFHSSRVEGPHLYKWWGVS